MFCVHLHYSINALHFTLHTSNYVQVDDEIQLCLYNDAATTIATATAVS
jgi:hypothetical protein